MKTLSDSSSASWQVWFRAVICLFLLVWLAYLPALTLPFISDDYSLIPVSEQYLAVPSLLFHSAELRTRLTYVLWDGGLVKAFGFTPLPFYFASIVLHFVCTLLVYASGSLRLIGWRRSFWAACFFAIFEGHQEAVMWVAASMELLLFLFGMGAVLLWHQWLVTKQARWFAFSFLSFLVALTSKESAWIFPALMFAVAIADRVPLRKAILGCMPFAAVAVAYVIWLAMARTSNGRFNDGSFSLHASWLLNDFNSIWHLLLVWGLLALLVIWWRRDAAAMRIAWFGCLWMMLSLLPYSFLTYMPRVPSRHTYLASVGLAWLVAQAFVQLRTEFPRASVFVAGAVLLINGEILWVKKMSQFRERAEPTELLKLAAKHAVGPVHIRSIPVSLIVARAVLDQDHHEMIVDQPKEQGDAKLLDIWYRDQNGTATQVKVIIGAEHHGWFR